MCDSSSVLWKLRQIVGEDRLLEQEPLSEHTTFCIGGPARMYVLPDTPEELRDIIETCVQSQTDYLILGCGSDLLVADEGFDGVVISLTDGFVNVSVDGTEMTCAAGVPLKEASEMACELGLSGLEFSCGIPGSIGGAVFMNAGAYDGCIADVLVSARVLTADGQLQTRSADELDLSYRHSAVQDENLVVLSATFSLKPADQEAIRAKMEDFTERRVSKQPLELPSAGSTFKRPEGHFAGKLIIDAGCQGYRVGGAEVSRKHAGFVVNVDHATAQDVHAVIEHVQSEVYRQFGVVLEPEVRFIGGAHQASQVSHKE